MEHIQIRKLISRGIIFICLFAVACQPTPSTDIVVNKKNNDMEIAIKNPPVVDKVCEFPDEWEDTFQFSNATVEISAPIIAKKECKYPVITIREKDFTRNELHVLLNSIFGEIDAIREQPISYDEAVEDLLEIEKGEYVGMDEETNEPIFEPFPNQEAEIKQQLELIESLPTESTFLDYKDERIPFPIDDYLALRLRSSGLVFIRGSERKLSASTFRNYIMQRENWILQSPEGGFPGEVPHPFQNINIEEEKAVALTDEIVEKMNMPDMAFASADKARAIWNNEVLDEGWWIEYTYSGGSFIPMHYDIFDDSALLKFAEGYELFAPSWHMEYLFFFVTDDGVRIAQWGEPKEKVMIANENVQLMPFQEIKEAAKKAFRFGFSWTDGVDIHPELICDKIELGVSIQQVKNQKDEAFLIPTWFFIISTENDRLNWMDDSILAINAIDGSIILHE